MKKTHFQKTIDRIKREKQDKIQELIQLDFNELKQLKKDSYNHYETVRELGFKEATEIRYELYRIIDEALQVKNGNEETAWDGMT